MKIERMRKSLSLHILCFCLLIQGSAWAAPGDGVLSEVVSKSTASWDGVPLPAYEKGKPEITILCITIPPQTVLALHEHKVINAGVLISGELTVVTSEGRILHLKAGEGIIEVVNTVHYGKNEGQIPAQIIGFYAGSTITPSTVNK
jgi:quercetin dioxygenase-like cupin family protein